MPGVTWVNEAEKFNGSLENTDDIGFQFTHTRGYIIIESCHWFCSSDTRWYGVHIICKHYSEEGTTLAKGDELGYFTFGSSDIIV